MKEIRFNVEVAQLSLSDLGIGDYAYANNVSISLAVNQIAPHPAIGNPI